MSEILREESFRAAFAADIPAPAAQPAKPHLPVHHRRQWSPLRLLRHVSSMLANSTMMTTMRNLFLIPVLAVFPTGCSSFEAVTPLMKAASNGNLEKVKKLVQSGTPVDQNSKYKWTPLMFAVNKGNADIAAYLLSKGADPNHRSERIANPYSTTVPVPESSPVQEAVYVRRLDILEKLIAAGGSVNRLDTIEWAVRNGDIPMMTVIFKQKVDQRIKDRLLIYASGPVLRWMVAHGCGINGGAGDVFRTVLGVAMEQATLDDGKWLIANGANVDMATECGETPLIYCAEKNLGPERLEFLLKNGASVDAFGGTTEGTRGTALTWATRRIYDKKDLESVRVLLRHGAKLSIRDDYGETAIEILRKEIGKNPVILNDDVHLPDLVLLLKEMEQKLEDGKKD